MKIVARMRGGLGNQLFIIAYAFKLAEDHKSDDYCIVLDLRDYEHNKIRQFELKDVIDNSVIRTYGSADFSLKYEISRSLYHLTQHFFRSEKWKDVLLYPLSKLGLYYSGLNVTKYTIQKRRKTIFVFGYFQSAKVSIGVINSMKSFLGIEESGQSGNINEKRIAISVRCGQDYIDGGWKLCDKAYFQKGIKYILEHKHYENYKVLVFTDDVEKAKTMEIDGNAVYIESATPVEQLKLMSTCNDFVLSNSSFSWWGALLGKKDDSIIIAPEIWYHSDKKTKDCSIYYSGLTIL